VVVGRRLQNCRRRSTPHVGEALTHVHAELGGERRRPDGATLELQDDLANQPFVRRRPVGASERNVAAIDRAPWIPRYRRSDVDAVHMTE
jgi:hypothetical protein